MAVKVTSLKWMSVKITYKYYLRLWPRTEWDNYSINHYNKQLILSEISDKHCHPDIYLFLWIIA